MTIRLSFALSTAVVVTLNGCGFINNPASSLPASFVNEAALNNQGKAVEGGVAVVVSYPARIDPKIRLGVVSRYAKTKFSSEISADPWPESFDNMLTKTTFYARDFHRALAARFPKGQVVLQPAELTADPDGKLAYRIVGEALPAVARVDFMAYSAPTRAGVPMDGQTFGPYVTPLIAVSTSATVSPATQGVLSTMDRFPALAAEGRQPSVLLQILAKGGGARGIDAPRSPERVVRAGQIITTPFVELKIDDKSWADYLLTGPSSSSPAASLFAPYAGLVVDLVLSINSEAALAAPRADYYAKFDPAATQEPAGSPKRQLLDRFIAAEATFLHRSGITMIDALNDGEFGTSMRERITAEREIYDAHSKADMKLALGALLLGATGAAAGGPVFDPVAASQFSRTAEETFERVFKAHAHAISGVASQQFTTTVEVQGTTRTVQASSLLELRSQFKKMYVQRFRL